jgi:hypothetical protein
MSVKYRAILALMTRFELCTDRMSGFMELDKPSSICNYYVEPHLPASCGVFTFWRENEGEGQDFILGAGGDFDIVGTYEWFSYVRASRSQAYDVLVRFFPCMVYINSSCRDTLGYEWQLVVAVIS